MPRIELAEMAIPLRTNTSDEPQTVFAFMTRFLPPNDERCVEENVYHVVGRLSFPKDKFLPDDFTSTGRCLKTTPLSSMCYR